MNVPTPPTRLLRVDLSTREVTSVSVPEQWRERYLGGKGLGARYLYDELDPGTDPLGSENVLLFMLGPLSGFLPGEPRHAVVTKSPLTGTYLDSYAGGSFPGILTGALGEHVGILVEGRADRPVRLVVRNGEATVEDSDQWGSDTVSVTMPRDGEATAAIGPAGERLVRYATIASDGGEHHAGRGGAGAVMGSKRLKSVVARGDPPSGLDRLRSAYEARYEATDVATWRRASGTIESLDFADTIGALATEGWQTSRFDDVDSIGIETVRERSESRERGDGIDPGDFRVETDDGETVPRGGTLMSLGAGLGIDDFDAIVDLGDQCNRVGVDLISAGSAVAWAIRASREGLVDRPLQFGDPIGCKQLLEETAFRETELGDALANGVTAAVDSYGGDSFVPTVKAMELPAYDPRGASSMALAYATSDRGACHRRAIPIERAELDGDWNLERVAKAVIESQNRRSVLWSLVLDDFVGAAFEDLGAEWLEAVGVSPDGDLRTVGERIWTLTRLFNVREGFDRDDDSLPSTLAESFGSAGSDGGVDPERFEAMLQRYYKQRGWTVDGVPTGTTLGRLGLEEVVDPATPVGDESATPR